MNGIFGILFIPERKVLDLPLYFNFPFSEIQDKAYWLTRGDEIVDKLYLVSADEAPNGFQFHDDRFPSTRMSATKSPTTSRS